MIFETLDMEEHDNYIGMYVHLSDGKGGPTDEQIQAICGLLNSDFDIQSRIADLLGKRIDPT